MPSLARMRHPALVDVAVGVDTPEHATSITAPSGMISKHKFPVSGTGASEEAEGAGDAENRLPPVARTTNLFRRGAPHAPRDSFSLSDRDQLHFAIAYCEANWYNRVASTVTDQAMGCDGAFGGHGRPCLDWLVRTRGQICSVHCSIAPPCEWRKQRT
jgi:hypothetical protein